MPRHRRGRYYFDRTMLTLVGTLVVAVGGFAAYVALDPSASAPRGKPPTVIAGGVAPTGYARPSATPTVPPQGQPSASPNPSTARPPKVTSRAQRASVPLAPVMRSVTHTPAPSSVPPSSASPSPSPASSPEPHCLIKILRLCI